MEQEMSEKPQITIFNVLYKGQEIAIPTLFGLLTYNQQKELALLPVIKDALDEIVEKTGREGVVHGKFKEGDNISTKLEYFVSQLPEGDNYCLLFLGDSEATMKELFDASRELYKMSDWRKDILVVLPQ